MMLLKQFLVGHIIGLHAGSIVLAPVKSIANLAVARLKKGINMQIPDGYQDEQGFHFGVKPVATQDN
jgi:hypothetical protein